MSGRDDPRIRRRELILKLLKYLLERPDAKDTLEGVICWWLPQNGRGFDATEVLDALDSLISKGLVTASTIVGSTVIYGTQRDRLRDIELFLERNGAK